jgi:hypothetical protein
MSAAEAQVRGGALLYNPERALDRMLSIGVTPVRVFSVLFPLWEVEVIGTQRHSRPYEMLELFVERGIEEGRFHSGADLAAFFGLEQGLVEKMLIFLQQIGHVQRVGDRLSLTTFGQESLKAGVNYRNMETRRKLYFDAFRSRPLPQEHYRLPILSETEAMMCPDRRYYRLFSFQPWQTESLAALARHPERTRWNLPDEVRDLRETAVNLAYLPMYIFEARERVAAAHFAARYLVFTRVRDLRDPFFEEIINSDPNLISPLVAEALDKVQALMERELADRGLDSRRFRLTELAPDAWRAIVSAEAFLSSQVRLSLADIGRHLPVRGYFLQIWCDDPTLRRDAALDQMLTVVAHWRHPATQKAIAELLERLSDRFKTRQLALADLREWAKEREANDVLAKLQDVEGV